MSWTEALGLAVAFLKGSEGCGKPLMGVERKVQAPREPAHTAQWHRGYSVLWDF